MTTTDNWTGKDIPDLMDRVVIVTGANSGIGYETTRALAANGATVVMACRDTRKGNQAAREIFDEHPQAILNVMRLDLADLDSVRQFASDFLAQYDRLDILINNAGVMATPYRRTADGFEMQFGTNHLGHFALTGLLIDRLKSTADSRVVTVTSFAHRMGRIKFNDLNSEIFYQPWLAYGQSKLANLLFTYELNRKLSVNGNNPISVAVHPGYASTNLQAGTGFQRLNPLLAQSQEAGALPTLYAATSEDISGGDFIGPDGIFELRGFPTKARSSRASYDEQTAQKLWIISEGLTGIGYDL